LHTQTVFVRLECVDSVAQLVEQWTFNPLVQGSNPCGVTKFNPTSTIKLLNNLFNSTLIVERFSSSRRDGLKSTTIRFTRYTLNPHTFRYTFVCFVDRSREFNDIINAYD
jgi:hypothetical protein